MGEFGVIVLAIEHWQKKVYFLHPRHQVKKNIDLLDVTSEGICTWQQSRK